MRQLSIIRYCLDLFSFPPSETCDTIMNHRRIWSEASFLFILLISHWCAIADFEKECCEVFEKLIVHHDLKTFKSYFLKFVTYLNIQVQEKNFECISCSIQYKVINIKAIGGTITCSIYKTQTSKRGLTNNSTLQTAFPFLM